MTLLIKDHLYKNKNELYYISEWQLEGLQVELFVSNEEHPELYEDDLFKDNFQLKSLLEFKEYIENYKIDLEDLGTFLETDFEFQSIWGYGKNTNLVLVDLNARLINTIGWFSNNLNKKEKKKLGILKRKTSDNLFIDHDGKFWNIFTPLSQNEAKILKTPEI